MAEDGHRDVAHEARTLLSGGLADVGAALDAGARQLVDRAREMAPARDADPAGMFAGSLGSAAAAGLGIALTHAARGVRAAAAAAAPAKP